MCGGTSALVGNKVDLESERAVKTEVGFCSKRSKCAMPTVVFRGTVKSFAIEHRSLLRGVASAGGAAIRRRTKHPLHGDLGQDGEKCQRAFLRNRCATSASFEQLTWTHFQFLQQIPLFFLHARQLGVCRKAERSKTPTRGFC